MMITTFNRKARIAFAVSLICVGLSVVFLGCSVKQRTAPSDAERYAVYSVAFKHLKLREQVEPFRIFNRTTTYDEQVESAFFGDDFSTGQSLAERLASLKKMAPTVNDETLLDYDAGQFASKPLGRHFDIQGEYVLVDDFSVRPVVTFSGVGFNETHTEAYLYMYYRGGFGGRSDGYLLKKSGENWQVSEVFEGVRSG